MNSPSDSLPPITLVPLAKNRPPAISSLEKAGRAPQLPRPMDARWQKVEEFLQSANRSPNTRKVYERELKRFCHWTDLDFSKMRSLHLKQYKKYLMAEVTTEQGKPLSNSSINAAITALKSFFKWFTRKYPDLLPTNPTAGVPFEKISLPLSQGLTAEEMERICQALDRLGETKERDTALVHILTHGLRTSEIVNLNVGAWDGSVLTLTDPKPDRPKSIALRPESGTAIQVYLQWREAEGERLTHEDPLILSHHSQRRGERLSYHGIYFAIEKIGELAGIPGLHPLQLRHTARSCFQSNSDPPADQ